MSVAHVHLNRNRPRQFTLFRRTYRVASPTRELCSFCHAVLRGLASKGGRRPSKPSWQWTLLTKPRTPWALEKARPHRTKKKHSWRSKTDKNTTTLWSHPTAAKITRRRMQQQLRIDVHVTVHHHVFHRHTARIGASVINSVSP